MFALPAFGLLVLMQTPPVPPAAPRPPAAGQAPAPQSRDQTQRSPLVGKGSISGVVVGENGQSIKGARVTLSGVPIARTTTTDGSGAFTFEMLPQGRYGLSASRTRYLPGSYGQKRAERSGTPLQLADTEHLKDLSITLFSASVIAGTVFADDGEPVQGAQVRAYRYTMSSGIRRLQSANTATSDDRGAYRIFGLVPGEYLVSATSSSQLDNGSAFTAEMAVAIERAAQSAANLNITSINNGSVTLSNGQTVEASPPVTYAPTYYPGSPSLGSAVTIPVRGGEERSGIDVALQKVQTATVSGQVMSAAGPLPSNITVSLQPADETQQNVSLPSARVGPDGRFSMRAVPPGQYTISARATTTVRTDAPPAAAGIGAGNPLAAQGVQTMQTTQTTTMTGRASVSVDGQPLAGILISLDPGHALTGRISFEGAAPPDLTRARVQVTAQQVQAANGQFLPSPSPADVAPDGTFRIAGIAPGRYTLRLSNTPNGWSMRSSVVAGRDSLDFPFEVESEDIVGATITVTPPHPPAELSGTMTDAHGKPVSDYTILVFTTDQRFWTPNSRRIFTQRPGTDGKYILRGLQPGDYHIAALSDVEPGTQFDPELLKTLIVTSTRVTLGDGAKLTQDLRISGS